MCYSKMRDPKFTKFSYNNATDISTTFIWLQMTVHLGLVFSSQKEVTKDIGQTN